MRKDDRGRLIMEPLWGTPAQRAGGIWVINSREQCKLLLEDLLDSPLSGCDTELSDCDIRNESPVGKARIRSWSVAFIDESLGKHPDAGIPLARRAWIPNYGLAEDEGWLYDFRPWLESSENRKTGSTFLSVDQHAFREHGITVNGVRRDQVRQSQIAQEGRVFTHGLKAACDTHLLYEMKDYDEVFGILLFTKGKGRCKTCNPEGLRDDGDSDCPACKGLGWKEPPKPYKTGQRRMVDLRDVEAIAERDMVTPKPGSDPHLVRMLEEWRDYGSLDAKGSLETTLIFDAKLDKMRWMGEKTMLDFYEEEWGPFQYVIWGIESTGWPCDVGWLEEQRVRCYEDMARLEAKLNAWNNGNEVNWGSNVQKAYFLYGDEPKAIAKSFITPRSFPVPPVTKKGPTDFENDQWPTDSVALDYLRVQAPSEEERQLLGDLMYYTKCETMRKNYLDKMPGWVRPNGRIYSRIGTETRTGRLTSKVPPLNTLSRSGWDPKEPWIGDPYDVRESLTCNDGYGLLSLDYSQLEMRVLAHYLIVLFGKIDPEHAWDLAKDLESGDLHAQTAVRVWGQLDYMQGVTAGMIKKHPDVRVRLKRNAGKIINFSVNYGKTEVGLGSDIRDEHGEPIGEKAAGELLRQYFEAYRCVKRYHTWAKKYVHANGYVRTLGGRYRYLPDIHSRKMFLVRAAERAALNTPIQGSALDVIMKAMLRANALPIKDLRDLGYFDPDLYDMGVQLLMQVHDELVYAVPIKYLDAAAERIQYHMERPFHKTERGFLSTGVLLPVDRGGAKEAANGNVYYPVCKTYRETK